MEYVHNPMTGTVRYVTRNYASFLKCYGWRKATFEMFMAWQCAQYALYPVETSTKSNVVYLNDAIH